MNRVFLHGELEKYGTGFSIDAGNPVEAFHALDMQLAGFRETFRRGNYVAIRETPDGKFLIEEDQLLFNCYNTKIHFCPQVEGAKSGTVKTIIGVALFVGSLFIPGGTAGWMIFGQSVKTIGLMAGASLALSGVSLMLAPQIKMSDTKNEEDKSFLYGGNIQSAGQDFVIPITYGDDRVDGIIVSSEIVTGQIGVSTAETYDGTRILEPTDWGRPPTRLYLPT